MFNKLKLFLKSRVIAAGHTEHRNYMRLFSLEHGKMAYRADFALYFAAVTMLATFLVFAGPRPQRFYILTFAVLGLGLWTIVEYGLHRFVLHGVQPFHRWHLQHHQRPLALICAPTILSATLFGVLVFFPALMLGNLWSACALTLGMLVGYLAYAMTHHATHHWHGNNAWLRHRKRWHALHHFRHIEQPGRYGVTSAFWDYVFGSARRPRQ